MGLKPWRREKRTSWPSCSAPVGWRRSSIVRRSPDLYISCKVVWHRLSVSDVFIVGDKQTLGDGNGQTSMSSRGRDFSIRCMLAQCTDHMIGLWAAYQVPCGQVRTFRESSVTLILNQ